jgi:hypothetical protein
VTTDTTTVTEAPPDNLLDWRVKKLPPADAVTHVFCKGDWKQDLTFRDCLSMPEKCKKTGSRI